VERLRDSDQSAEAVAAAESLGPCRQQPRHRRVGAHLRDRLDRDSRANPSEQQPRPACPSRRRDRRPCAPGPSPVCSTSHVDRLRVYDGAPAHRRRPRREPNTALGWIFTQLPLTRRDAKIRVRTPHRGSEATVRSVRSPFTSPDLDGVPVLRKLDLQPCRRMTDVRARARRKRARPQFFEQTRTGTVPRIRRRPGHGSSSTSPRSPRHRRETAPGSAFKRLHVLGSTRRWIVMPRTGEISRGSDRPAPGWQALRRAGTSTAVTPGTTMIPMSAPERLRLRGPS